MVITLIEAGLCRETPLAALAQSVNLSPSRLRHLFKAETGPTLAQYLKHLRMESKTTVGDNLSPHKSHCEPSWHPQLKPPRARFQKAYGLTPAGH
jgi:methylphosphotriester-DNA--protein-cysteine methyltransferase